MGTPGDSAGIDPDRLARVVELHPVRLAVLFGSHARGVATADSDVDVAVAFEDGMSRTERLDARIDLVVDLIDALGTDDVDVSDLDGIRSAVGASAIRSGRVLVGDRDELDEYLERFERDASDDGTHVDRMRRFDSLLERLEGRV